MKETTLFILFIIIIFIAISNYNKSNKEVSLIKSTIDNREYRVLKSYNEIEAANLLANINNDILILIDSFKDEKDDKYKRLQKYNPDSLHENLETHSYKAYSLNKGQEIVICIRDDNGKLIDDKNTLIFVIIHELSHVMTEKNGHPPIFWENMSILLKRATEINIYTPYDYSKYPVDYCGMIINNTPYKF